VRGCTLSYFPKPQYIFNYIIVLFVETPRKFITASNIIINIIISIIIINIILILYNIIMQ
jgi:hypothetical protein